MGRSKATITAWHQNLALLVASFADVQDVRVWDACTKVTESRGQEMHSRMTSFIVRRLDVNL